MAQEKPSLSRREFLQRLAIGTAGAVFAVHTGSSVWAVRREADGPENDPRNIDNAKTISRQDFNVLKEDAAAGGGLIKPPNLPKSLHADLRVQQCSNGKYLGWTVNTNPVWMWGGEAVDTRDGQGILWGQPDIAVYGDDLANTYSFSELVEVSDGYLLAVVKNDSALVQAVSTELIDGLWLQQDRSALIQRDLRVDAIEPAASELSLPTVSKSIDTGFTIECWVKVSGDAVILQADDFSLKFDNTAQAFQLRLGETNAQSEPGSYTDGNWQHVCVIVDRDPRFVSWMINGQFQNGDPQLTAGVQHFNTELHSPNAAEVLQLAKTPTVEIGTLRIYERPLRAAECLSSYHYYGQGMGIYDYIEFS